MPQISTFYIFLVTIRAEGSSAWGVENNSLLVSLCKRMKKDGKLEIMFVIN